MFIWCVLSATPLALVPEVYATTCQTSLVYTRLVLNGGQEMGPLSPKVEWLDIQLVPAETASVLESSRVLPAVLQVIGDRVHAGQENPLRLPQARSDFFNTSNNENFLSFEPALKAMRLPSYTTSGTIEMKGKKAGESSVQRVKIGGSFKYFRQAEPDDADDFLGPAKLAIVRKTAIIDQIIRDFFPETTHFVKGRFALVNGKRGWLTREVGGLVEKKGILGKCDKSEIYFMEAVQFLLNGPDIEEESNLALENGHLVNFDVDFALQPGVGVLKSDSQKKLSKRIGAILPDFYPLEFVEGLEKLVQELMIRPTYASPSEIYFLLFRAHVILADIEARGPQVILSH